MLFCGADFEGLIENDSAGWGEKKFSLQKYPHSQLHFRPEFKRAIVVRVYFGWWDTIFEFLATDKMREGGRDERKIFPPPSA